MHLAGMDKLHLFVLFFVTKKDLHKMLASTRELMPMSLAPNRSLMRAHPLTLVLITRLAFFKVGKVTS